MRISSSRNDWYHSCVLSLQVIDPVIFTPQPCNAGADLCADSLSSAHACRLTDQGLVNTDPRHIAVPADAVNMVPVRHLLSFPF